MLKSNSQRHNQKSATGNPKGGTLQNNLFGRGTGGGEGAKREKKSRKDGINMTGWQNTLPCFDELASSAILTF